MERIPDAAAHAYHDQAGDVYAAHAAVAPHNAYPDRPAMFALAGDVAGLRILDAAAVAAIMRPSREPSRRCTLSTQRATRLTERPSFLALRLRRP
ncbi:hypothetical protein [Micromonospora sp. RV43]|uniref:hypothetical protein n=1 Tax=Micromonospora sp. RV43 TaxID=1661387 RepID=UPI001F393125|nr:hypothetical protein [Micromonospora sp. RV43]